MTPLTDVRHSARNAGRFSILAGVVLLTAVLTSLLAVPSSHSGALGTVVNAGIGSAVPGRYIVMLRPPVQPADVEPRARALTTTYGGTVEAVYTRALAGFAMRGTDIQADRIAGDARVASVEQEQWARALGTQNTRQPPPGVTWPNPPGQLWNLDRIDQGSLPLDGRFSYGTTTVPIYVVDDGVFTAHVDFGGRAQIVHSEFGTNERDCSGHGTAVAAIAAGTTYGVAKQASVRSIKVGDCAGTTDTFIRGLNWLLGDPGTTRPAVVNISVGFNFTDPAVDTAVMNVMAAGFTVVLAAGNEDTDACNDSPQRLGRSSAAIVVSATGSSDARWQWANTGPCVSLFAPGVDVISASSTSTTGAVDPPAGTSFAAPQVSGAAALVLAAHPSFTPQQVKDAILADATPNKVSDPGPDSPNRLLYLPPPDQPPTVVTNSNLNDLFNAYGNQGNHWTGADESMSQRLPDGRVAWFFSDVFLGTVNADGSRPTSTPMVHNAIVVQQGSSLVQTLTGGTPDNPKSLVGADTDGQPGDLGWWSAEGQVVGSQVQVFYTHVKSGGAGVLSYIKEETGVATFALPSLALQSLTVIPALGDPNTWWGAAMVDGRDGYTYVYGTESQAGNNYLHIARAPNGLLPGTPGASGAWQFWTGSSDSQAQWASDASASARVLTGIGTGFSVKYLDGRFVLVSFDVSQPFTNRIMAFFAEKATGPFAHPTFVYAAPLPSPQALVYTPRLHPEQNGSGGYVLSYNANSFDPADIYRDVRIYRPKFVNVTLSPPVDPALLPDAPTNLTVTSLATDRVRLSWTPPAGTGLRYWVYQRNASLSANWFTRAQSSLTTTSVDIGFLAPGTYELQVSAQNSVGEGPRSVSAWATITIPAPATAPANLAATANDDGTVSLRWDPVAAAGWVSYHVYQRDVTAGQTDLRPSNGAVVTGTTAKVSGLQTGDTYAFTVSAFNGGGEGPQSSPVQVTTRIAPPPPPTNLTARANDDGTITLTWTAPAPGLWYWVYMRDVTAGGSFTQLAYPVTTGTTFTAGLLTIGHTYAFYVTAIGAGGLDSPPSNTVQETARAAPPPAPANLVATANSDGTIGLSWNSSGSGVWYWVYMRDVTAGESFSRLQYPVTTGTTFTAGYLTIGHTYAFYVTAIGPGGVESPPSNTAQATATVPPPAAPTSLVATANADGTITLSWRAPAPELWYWIYTKDVTAGGSFTRSVYPVTTGTTFTAGLLTVGHTYAFYVTAINAGGESPPSNTAQATSYVPPPAAPTNLTATPGDGTVTLSWTAPAPGLWYWVYMRDVTVGDPFTRLQYPVTTGTTWTGGMLTNGHAYAFYVTAINAGGESPPSNVVQAVPQVPPPAPPSNLTATANPNGTITLSWTAPAPNLWYWVYMRDVTSGGAFTRLPYPVTTGTTWTGGLLTIGHTYAFYVTAINAGGESAPSNVAQATSYVPRPPAPANVTATANRDATITVCWSSVGPGVMYWVYMRDVTAGGSFARIQYPLTSTCFTAGYLTLNHTYAFSITAVNAGGEGPASATVQATASFPAPTSLIATWTNINTAHLYWSSVNPNGLFYVYYRDVTAGGAWVRLYYPVSGRTYQDVTPLLRHAYQFKVTQAGNGGESAPSNIVYLSQQPNPYAYTRAQITCTVYEIHIPDVGIIGWTDISWSAWGVGELSTEIKVSFWVTRDGATWWYGWALVDTGHDGSWSYGLGPLDSPLSFSRYDLKINVQDRYGTILATTYDTCYGGLFHT